MRTVSPYLDLYGSGAQLLANMLQLGLRQWKQYLIRQHDPVTSASPYRTSPLAYRLRPNLINHTPYLTIDDLYICMHHGTRPSHSLNDPMIPYQILPANLRYLMIYDR